MTLKMVDVHCYRSSCKIYTICSVYSLNRDGADYVKMYKG